MSTGKYKCPHCGHLILIIAEQKHGICDRCTKFYIVHYHLSRITLDKEFILRNYETEVLRYIEKRGRSYASEISIGIGASKGVVSMTLRGMIERKLLEVKPRGRTRWVSLPKEG